MPTVIDLLRHLGRRAGPSETNAVSGLLSLPQHRSAPAQIDLPRQLIANWGKATGRRVMSEHVLALSALRSGETPMLMGPEQVTRADLLLLMAGALGPSASATALYLVPDEQCATRVAAYLDQVLPALSLAWCRAREQRMTGVLPRIVLATYDDLHQYMLPFADRAWEWFWAYLEIIVVPDFERAAGSWGNHLLWLLRRSRRRAAHDPQIIGSLTTTASAVAVAQMVIERPCRIITSPMELSEETQIVVWRCEDRVAAQEYLSRELAARRLAITVVGQTPEETNALRKMLPPNAGLVAGLPPSGARIAIVAGIPFSPAARESLLRYGYRLLIMLASDEPHEQLIASELPQTLLQQAPLAVSVRNPYVAISHLHRAAVELPLIPAEVRKWQAQELTERLISKGQLLALGDGVLQSSVQAPVGGRLRAWSDDSGPAIVYDSHGLPVAYLTPAAADRYGVPGTSWPDQQVVAHRVEDSSDIVLAKDESRRCAVPQITVRFREREQGTSHRVVSRVGMFSVTRWKVQVTQIVEGLVEWSVGQPPARLSLAQRPEYSWTSLACSIPLAVAPPDPAIAGWVLLAVLPALSSISHTDVIVSYDAATAALWLVESEPGGTGIIDCFVENCAMLLEATESATQALLTSDLHGVAARRELDWLEPLLQQGAAPDEAKASPDDEPAERELTHNARVYDAAPVSLPQGVDGEVHDVALESPRELVSAEEDLPPSDTSVPLQPPPIEGDEDVAQPQVQIEESEELAPILVESDQDLEGSAAQQPEEQDNLIKRDEADQDHAVDVNAMIARVRTLREAHELNHSASPTQRPNRIGEGVRQRTRFRRGERVKSTPYGEGIVERVWIDAGAERLLVLFQAEGRLVLDVEENDVRHVEVSPPEDDFDG